MKSVYYCGNPGFRINDILGIGRPKNGIFSWFENKKISKTFMARTAIQRIVEILGIGPQDELLIPSYNCGSEIDPLYKSGTRISVYRVDKSARVDFDDVKRKISGRTRAIYLTHYFGFLSDAVEMAKLCRDKNLLLIEDCALSLFSEINGRKAGTFGNVAVFSISKTVPVRAGALVINDEHFAQKEWQMRSPGNDLNSILPLIKGAFFETLQKFGLPGPLMKSAFETMRRHKDDDFDYYSFRPPIAGHMFCKPELADLKITAISDYFLNRIDPKEVIEKRRRNFLLLLQNVKARPGIAHFFHDLPPGVCPLYFPVLALERARLCKYLFQRMIDAPQWWFGYHPSINWDDFPEACYLKDHLLQLPIHWRLSEQAMLYIARQVNEF
jgi:dTDP-4-amino-4,6-dideoxygalactose transaminase